MTDCEFTWEETDLQCVIGGRGVQISFKRTGDRWTHHLSFTSSQDPNDGPRVLASALEHQGDADDPTRIVSPVYQEISRHEFAGDRMRGVCALLTGRLLTHHFSAAISLFEDPGEPGSVLIDFDVADRCRAPVSSLAATYALRLGSSELKSASSQAIAWGPMEPGAAAGWGLLELLCDSPGGLALAEAGRQSTRVQALAPIDPSQFTHRLRYRWRWASTPTFTR
jgi:hypothetical protein